MTNPLPRIGTAGWTIPARYAAEMPSGGSQLERYARKFSAVEINSSFHRPHQRQTYARWAQSTPASFRFSVKLPKTMSHDAQLVSCGPLLDRFAAEVAGLGGKLSVLLVQLPPKLGFDGVAHAFFCDLRRRFDTPVALEPRNGTWFTPEVGSWLAERRVARVAADPARAIGAGEPGGWTGLAYFRWHGAPRVYFSDYDAAALGDLKRRLEKHRARDCPTWCIFDNTASGAALGNALALTRSISGQPG